MKMNEELSPETKPDAKQASSAVETIVIPPKYFIRSKYCGTYVKNAPVEFEEAEAEKERLNKEAIELGFNDIQFELVEA